MKTLKHFFPIVTVAILAAMLCCAGCTTSRTTSGVPMMTTVPPAPAQTPAATLTAVPGTYLTFADLPEGITITYPADWEIEKVSSLTLKDYGRTTRTVADLYSPDITPDRARSAEPNPDDSRNTHLSIDIEPELITNFEGYFHNASLALDSKYRKYKITKHNYQLQMSVTDDFSGYPSYQLNFDGTGVRGSYIFTNVDGKVYIFAFRNPSPYSQEVADIIRSVRIDG